MKNSYKGLLIIIVSSLFIISCNLGVSVSEINGTGIRFSVPLRDGIVDVIITHDEDHRAWAENLIIPTIQTLQGMESYLDMSMPITQDIRIKGANSALVNSSTVNGYNTSFEIALSYNSVTDYDLTTHIHELIHYWARSPIFDQDWLIEGLASFLPYVLADEGYITLTELQKLQTRVHYNFDYNPSYNSTYDEVFPDSFSDSTSSAFINYVKSFKIHYLLRSYLGKSKYRSFLQKLFQEEPQTVSEAITILNSIESASWNSYLTGWLLSGSYHTEWDIDLFTDTDQDGLLDILEGSLFYNTSTLNKDSDSDNASDGKEVEMGWDPANGSDPGSTTVNSNGPYIDGTQDEWIAGMMGTAESSTADTVGDESPGTEPNYLDITNVETITQGNNLLIFVTVNAIPLTSTSNRAFIVQIDDNQDSTAEYQYYFFTSADYYSYYKDVSSNETIYGYNNAEMKNSYLSSPTGYEILVPINNISAGNFDIKVATIDTTSSPSTTIDETNTITISK